MAIDTGTVGAGGGGIKYPSQGPMKSDKKAAKPAKPKPSKKK